MDPSDDALATFPPPSVARSERPPGVVVAAAVVTWTAASITAAFSLCFGVLVLLFGDPVFDLFEGQNLESYVVATTVVFIALSAAANVLAYLVFRGHRWARWALIILSAASGLFAAMLGYYVAPLAVTVAAVAVVVLLFLRPARTWFRSARS